jgi:hypothetical protein
VGSRVSKIKTAKVIPAKAEIFKYFQGHHLSLEIYTRADLNEADIEKRLRAAGGAHQPSDMQFPGGGHEVKLVTAVEYGGSEGGSADAAPELSPRAAPSAAPSLPKSGSNPPMNSSGGGGGGGGGVGFGGPAKPDPKLLAKVARAGEEASAAALAIGKAAARLGELLKAAEGGQVSVADLEKLVASELGAASLRAAAAQAVIGEVKL